MYATKRVKPSPLKKVLLSQATYANLGSRQLTYIDGSRAVCRISPDCSFPQIRKRDSLTKLLSFYLQDFLVLLQNTLLYPDSVYIYYWTLQKMQFIKMSGNIARRTREISNSCLAFEIAFLPKNFPVLIRSKVVV